MLSNKWPKAKYIPYFQAYSNTYAPIEVLRKKYTEALAMPDVVGLAIATRPDCLNSDIIELLQEFSQTTDLFIELGLQTSNESTARMINRCYENYIFTKAVMDLQKTEAHIICHIMLGLPGETKQNMLNTVRFAAESGINGIKLQLLHVLKNTALAELYISKSFDTLTYEEYIDIVTSCIEILPAEVVIHRLTGDGAKDELISPLFSLNKRRILNGIDRELNNRNTWQGKLSTLPTTSSK